MDWRDDTEVEVIAAAIMRLVVFAVELGLIWLAASWYSDTYNILQWPVEAVVIALVAAWIAVPSTEFEWG